MDEPRDLLPRDQLRCFQYRSNLRGGWMLACNWALVAAAFALVALRPGFAGVVAALVLLGGRQLGLGILMHECAHRSLFASPGLNEAVGQWLCAAPMGADLTVYRAYHMTHHVKTGTEDDPDLANYAGYPVTRASLARKALRDLIGLTGVKALATLLVLYAHPDPSTLKFGYAYRQRSTAKSPPVEPAGPMTHRLGRLLWNMRRILVVQAMGLALLWACGHALLFLLWPLSWLTTYMLFSRIRNAAEHGGLPGTMSTDPWTNTRSVRARWWARLTVAPNFVNYHFEHHLAPTVPAWQLPRLHRWLAEQGVLAKAQVAPGYGAVLRALTAQGPA